MSLGDDVKLAVAIGLPVLELGVKLMKGQVDTKTAIVELEGLRDSLVEADRQKLRLAADVAADLEFGFPSPKT